MRKFGYKYPLSVWSFPGLRKEIDLLCVALERIRRAWQSMADTFEELE